MKFLTLVAIFLVVILYYRQPGLLEGFEDTTYDLRVRWLRSSVRPIPAIGIVTVDDRSINELGRFPWSREQFAKLLEVVDRAGAKAVLFDFIFPESQSKSVDTSFASSIRSFGRATLAGAFDLRPDGTISGLTANIPVLQQAASRIAHINVLPDEDGVIRWGKLALVHEGRSYPSLGLAGAAELVGVKDFTIERDAIVLGGRRIPTDAEQRMLINYTGPPGSHERFSFVDLVKGRIDPARLRGRVLFVGATAIGVYDMRISPFSNNTPGVEINANIADNIVRGDFITRGVEEALIDLGCIVFLGILTAFITFRLRHSASLPLVATLLIGYPAVACYLFHLGHWVSIVYPVLSILLSFAFAAYIRFFSFDRHAREIRMMFSSYVSKKVVDELVKNPALAKVGGESREITILFADVKNYTSYSETRTPAEVVRILNEYLAEMTDIILKCDGTLDKFLGDGILAYWNAPLYQEDHPEQAVRCALEMMSRMVQLQDKWTRGGDDPLAWGIALNTGEAIVGNIGAEGKKMEYTAIGDSVNLTYRIQNESREHVCPVITASLNERVKNLIHADPLGAVRVKGKQIPVEIYAVRGLRA